MISEGYRTHSRVTVPMNFKKNPTFFFFFRNSCSLDFGDPGCHPDTLIDLANSDLASRDLVETICMICEGNRTHRDVTGPMNFKSRTFFFFGKSCCRCFGAPGCHQSTLFDLANTAGASKNSLETICMFSEGYRTQRGVTGPMNFKKSGDFFSETRAPGILGRWLPFKYFNRPCKQCSG